MAGDGDNTLQGILRNSKVRMKPLLPLTRVILRHSAQPHGPVALMYHSVCPSKQKPVWPWAVSRQNFIEQLDYLVAEGYATPTVSELLADTKPWPARVAVITFDDGYADNLELCDELQRRRMRATWFVVAGSVGQAPRWPEDGRPTGRLLNAAELCVMQENGMEIGSHTVSHVRLTEVDDVRLMRELTDSKTMLEDILGKAVTSFAYPYGSLNEHCVNAVKAVGYAAACTTQTGWALRDNDPYRLRRLTVFNHDTLGCFARKLAFASHDISWADVVRHSYKRVRNRFR